ncbi:MAG: AmmeMemoRadiSam system radical SAM enzyme [Acidobacteriota bacterium]
MTGAHPARHWRTLDDGRVQCEVCPRDCRLREGQRGHCFVRRREDDRLVLDSFGHTTGACVDPIEKKPLNHFHPGSAVLSFGTAGCNLACRFCQNWDISKSREVDRLSAEASPEQVARAAASLGARSVAFTYNDPVIFLEQAVATAEACHERGIAAVAVTAAWMHDAARRDLFSVMDAANVDLKAFTEEFYRKTCGGSLQPVLDSLRYLKHETEVWLEITTLLIPGHNDSDAEVERLATWVRDELGPEVPLHFSAFHPDFRMLDLPRTPPATLTRARELARSLGLRHVYTGNVHDQDGDTTRCASCDAALIVRDWYVLLEYRLDARGRCPDCGEPLAGRFGAEAGTFGARRIPVDLGELAPGP